MTDAEYITVLLNHLRTTLVLIHEDGTTSSSVDVVATALHINLELCPNDTIKNRVVSVLEDRHTMTPTELVIRITSEAIQITVEGLPQDEEDAYPILENIAKGLRRPADISDSVRKIMSFVSFIMRSLGL